MKRIVKDPKDRKSEIIQVARELFLTKQFEKTTMQDVMDALGIAKGTIYHYFDSKEKLLEAVVMDLVNSRVTSLKSALQKFDGNALEKLKKLIALSNMSKEHPQLLEHLHQPIHAAMHIRILAETLIKLAPIYEKIIIQGCEEKIFQTKSPRECAEFILAAVQFLTDTGVYPWTKEDLKRRAQAFPKLIEQQLKAPPDAFQFLQL
ncbi:MAG TPA: TetR/AcrR family transcriptional regulator [Chlamydiales bacterium]|nr:MAG: hypothetical protein A3F67_11880 [Verrucomicrobia bacterium RIFCSPHIGHO2_12_FULL_41_10]HLB52578.1 TetR/AcrR family transcriptional regulator [Chlamydiales bacterium]